MSISVSIDHRRALGPVRDQGNRSTCLSHAATLAHEHARGSIDPLSPEYLHYFASGPGGGASFHSVASALRQPGQPTEADCPYLAGDPTSSWTLPGGVVTFRRESEPKNNNCGDIEALLNSGAVPVLGITLPLPFFTPSDPWVIPSAGPIHGRHAVTAVAMGIATNGKAVLIRNSWGAAWGDGGHAWLDETFLAQHLHDLMVLTHEVT